MSAEYHYVIIDDDPTNNLICKLTIEHTDKGIQVHTFTDSTDGLEFLKKVSLGETQYILLLDINMPVLSGWDILEDYMRWPDVHKRKVHVNMLTSSIDDRDKSRAKEEFNVSSFISKPLLKEQVLAMRASIKNLAY